ncbi:DUF6578 domain-containing protein [Streptomyces albidoflavus]|uniref:DUF6578 domain-containing protein n=1 Tax=Streptomyces albidoflavus TaxID=1886 RepID=UPI00344D90BC
MTVTIWIDGWQMQCCGVCFRSGTVEEVHCRYEVAGDGIGYPVPGSAEFVAVVGADGWAVERPGVGFVGYLVTAEPVVG